VAHRLRLVSLAGGRIAWAGFWLGVAAAFMVLQPLPLLWFLVHGERKAALTLAGTWLAIMATGVMILGPEVYFSWLRLLAGAPLNGQFHDASVMQMLVRTLSTTHQFLPVTIAPDAVRPIWAAAAGLIVALTVARRRESDRACLSVLSAAILVAPIGWIFAAWWFAGPAIALWLRGPGLTRVLLGATALVLWLPDDLPLWGQPSSWLTITVGSIFFWVVSTLWVVSTFGSFREVRVGLRA
jgi:hypothetical protein